jgi:hypothetical protein
MPTAHELKVISDSPDVNVTLDTGTMILYKPRHATHDLPFIFINQYVTDSIVEESLRLMPRC